MLKPSRHGAEPASVTLPGAERSDRPPSMAAAAWRDTPWPLPRARAASREDVSLMGWCSEELPWAVGEGDARGTSPPIVLAPGAFRGMVRGGDEDPRVGKPSRDGKKHPAFERLQMKHLHGRGVAIDPRFSRRLRGESKPWRPTAEWSPGQDGRAPTCHGSFAAGEPKEDGVRHVTWP